MKDATHLMIKIFKDTRLSWDDKRMIINYADQYATKPETWIREAEHAYHEALEKVSRR